MNIPKQIRRLLLALLAALLLLPSVAFADSHMNQSCTIEIHAQDVHMKYLTDYTFSTTVRFETGDWFSVRWSAKKPVAALYWEWRYIPARALVECLDDTGTIISSREYADKIRFLTVFPEENVSEIRMTVLEGAGDMAELFAYNQKQIPPKAVVWEEPLDKADIMLVETHGNDDCLIFGAVLPTYFDRGYTIQVVDIACNTIGRQRESSAGSYRLGLRNFKTFFEFDGPRNPQYAYYETAWLTVTPDPYEKLVAEIRRVRPEVVVTHDIENGDNGDGSHKMTAEITLQCIALAADPEAYPASAEQYGIWQVKKLYLHQAAEHPITIDVDTPLESFGGKTAYELSVEAITLWHGGDDTDAIRAVKRRAYHPCDYGLVFSTVGEDFEKNDFLENIPPEALSDYVPPTPAPTPEPTPVPTPEPTPEPTSEPTQESTPEPTAEPTQVPTPEPTQEPTPTPTETPVPVSQAPESADPSDLIVPLIWIGAAVVLLIACVIALILIRRKQR